MPRTQKLDENSLWMELISVPYLLRHSKKDMLDGDMTSHPNMVRIPDAYISPVSAHAVTQ